MLSFISSSAVYLKFPWLQCICSGLFFYGIYLFVFYIKYSSLSHSLSPSYFPPWPSCCPPSLLFPTFSHSSFHLRPPFPPSILFVLSCPKNLNHAIQLSSQYNKIKWNQLKIELRIGSLVSFFDRFLQHNIMYFCTNKDFVVCCIRIVALCVMPCLHIMFLPHCLESWMQHSLWITQSRRIFSDEMKQNKKENLKQRCHKGFCFYACLLLMCWSVLHHDIQTHIYIHVSIKEQICLIANNFFDQLVQSQSPWSWTTFLY